MASRTDVEVVNLAPGPARQRGDAKPFREIVHLDANPYPSGLFKRQCGSILPGMATHALQVTDVPDIGLEPGSALLKTDNTGDTHAERDAHDAGIVESAHTLRDLLFGEQGW